MRYNYKHGASSYPEYQIWKALLQRCENPNNAAYPKYGGRGITVSAEFHDFSTFFAHVGRRPRRGLLLDRINNNRGYVRNNLRWATPKQSLQNREKINRIRPTYGTPPTGKRFAYWTVLNGVRYHNRIAYWECRCNCGTVKFVQCTHLISKHTRSCGCK